MLKNPENYSNHSTTLYKRVSTPARNR